MSTQTVKDLLLIITVLFVVALFFSGSLRRVTVRALDQQGGRLVNVVLSNRAGRIRVAWVGCSVLWIAILIVGLPAIELFSRAEPSAGLKQMATSGLPRAGACPSDKSSSVAIPVPLLVLKSPEGDGSPEVHWTHTTLPKGLRASEPSEVRTLIWREDRERITERFQSGRTISNETVELGFVDRASGVTLKCLFFGDATGYAGVVGEAEILSELFELTLVDASGARVTPRLSHSNTGGHTL